jgi:hypothetical protein
MHEAASPTMSPETIGSSLYRMMFFSGPWAAAR